MFDKSKLEITPASFQKANELRRVVGEALNEKKISLGGDFDLEKIMDNEISGDVIGGIMSPLLSVVNSRGVEAAIFACAESALYDKNKINVDFFEPAERRELFFPIMLEVAKVNLAPFFGGLFSASNTIRQKIGSFLKKK